MKITLQKQFDKNSNTEFVLVATLIYKNGTTVKLAGFDEKALLNRIHYRIKEEKGFFQLPDEEPEGIEYLPNL